MEHHVFPALLAGISTIEEPVGHEAQHDTEDEDSSKDNRHTHHGTAGACLRGGFIYSEQEGGSQGLKSMRSHFCHRRLRTFFADLSYLLTMALIPQQDLVTVSSRDAESATKELRKLLESYPACRIVSLASHGQGGIFSIVAVVETI